MNSPGSNVMTVVEVITHQSPVSQPLQTESRYCRVLRAEDGPYMRTIKAGLDWKLLDCGWAREASLLTLENVEGRNRQVVPSEEERADTAARVIEVGAGVGGDEPVSVVPFALVRPGESCRLEPADPTRLYLRCRHESARCCLVITPS